MYLLSGKFDDYKDILIMIVLGLGVIICPPTLYIALAIFLPLVIYLAKKDYKNTIWMVTLLMATLEQVPNTITIQVVIFVLCWILAFLLPIINRDIRIGSIGWGGRLLLLFLIFVLFNSIVAMKNATHPISAGEWVRGAIPFIFLSMYLPVKNALREDKDVLKSGIVILLSSFFYAIQSFYYAYAEKIWQPRPWIIDDNGDWVKVASGIIPDNAKYFWERITMIFSQSTNEMFLIGFFIAVAIFLTVKNRVAKCICFIIWSFITFNLIITYSRSFHIIVMSGLIVLVILGLYLKQYKIAFRYIVVTLFTVLFTLTTVAFLDLLPMKNRYVALYQFTESYSSSNTNTNINTKNVDSNVSARMDEIKIAYDLFKEKPLLGQGLGIKHEIQYDVGFGKTLKYTKGYIHNSLFYFLMTMGISGLLIYMGIFFATIWSACKCLKRNYFLASNVLMMLFVLGAYSQFFAVFRLIDFNIILGMLIAINEKITDKERAML